MTSDDELDGRPRPVVTSTASNGGSGSRVRWLSPDHDLDGVAMGAAPERSVVVCTTPAAGEDLLAGVLRRCGAGAPAEYLDLEGVAAPLARRWGVINLDAYLAALHHHRSASSGVFGVVLQWRQLRMLHQRVAGLTQMSAERMSRIVDTIAPEPVYVFLRAAEQDRQAVIWHAAEGHTEGDYDPGAIARRSALIQATERTWRQWFDVTDKAPLEVVLDRRDGLEPRLEQIMEALGLDIPPDGPGTVAPPPESSTERSLLQRYRSDVATGTRLALNRSGR